MRYLVFASDFYYPVGGMGDLVARTDSHDEAWDLYIAYAKKRDECHVYDTVTGQTIFDS